ncbi:TATA-box binding family protein [Halorubrum saccharovorum DSM 1137]|uniref:TATA-box-binding protein n=1 Tax=Halorubrum saccharovorum DSM 1137 TaxID=1227484 RepID=M0DYL3_9EURY|nr:TATA-box-binding family protein [Halorubrum saccharovorum]ELZ40625.1 TATA-box binding family protein [Halorubrum saccharovorum DSM 1137]
MPRIDEIDEHISEEDLAENGLKVENIVATIDLEQEFDLLELRNYLGSSEYEPESFPFLVYKPSNLQGTVLIPTNGMASLVGCKSKKNLYDLGSHLINELQPIAPSKLPSTTNLEVQNIVIQGDLDLTLELNQAIIGLGMENTEYEPEQFPGVIYRPTEGTTILLFASGKYMVNGAKTYDAALSSVNNLLDTLSNSGLLDS